MTSNSECPQKFSKTERIMSWIIPISIVLFICIAIVYGVGNR